MKLDSFNRNYLRLNISLFFLWILVSSFGMIFWESEALSKEEVQLYDAHGKRDPFIPLISLSSRVASGLLGVETFDELIIEGIVYDPGKASIVVVNGAVMNVGEEVGSVKLVDVKADGATFSISGVEAFKAFNPESKAKISSQTSKNKKTNAKTLKKS